MAIRTVLFDIGGVLEVGEVIDSGVRPAWLTAIRDRQGWTDAELAERLGRGDPDGNAVIGGVLEGEVRRRYAAAFDLDEAGADAFMANFWDWYCGEPNTRMFDFIREELLGHVDLAILSNSADGARREEERRYALAEIFDPIFYSHEIGLAKPDPEVFRHVLKHLQCRPDEVVFVDDVEANVAAATAAGIVAVHHTDTDLTIRQVRERLDGAGSPTP